MAVLSLLSRWAEEAFLGCSAGAAGAADGHVRFFGLAVLTLSIPWGWVGYGIGIRSPRPTWVPQELPVGGPSVQLSVSSRPY